MRVLTRLFVHYCNKNRDRELSEQRIRTGLQMEFHNVQRTTREGVRNKGLG